MSNATELLRQAKNNLHGAKLCSVNSMSSRGEMLRLMDEAIKGIDEFLAAEPEQHQSWCASLTQLLLSHPPQKAPCNCRVAKPAEPEAEPVTDEPVAFCDLTLNGKSIAYFEGKPIIMVGNVGNACHPYALYLHPPRPEPAKKPMTEEEMYEGTKWGGDYAEGFKDGIRFAEKHHGIVDDE